MPWTAKDAVRFQSKATTAKLKKQWAAVANSVRAACIKDGGSEKKCDAKAVTQANGVIAKQVQENEMDNGSEWTMASVAQTAIEVGLAVARETDEIANDEAAKTLDLLHSKWNELGETTTQAPIVSIADVEVDGERVSLSDIVEFYRVGKAAEREEEEVVEAKKDELFPTDAARQAKLLVEASKLIDQVLCGLDDVAESAEEQEPSTDVKEDVVETDNDVPVVEEPLIEFDEGDAERAEFEESSDGKVLAIVEDGEGTRAAPMKLHIEVIRPGMGNAKMGRYYGAPMLRENAHMFKGAKMYPVNHRGKDKSVGNEVSMVLDCPVGFTERGGPIALVGVFDETFARNVRNRAALDALGSLECSILGEGDMRKGKVNGKQAFIVENISSVESIDWVTKAGAGGRALEIVENEDGGSNMTEGSVEDVVEEVPVEEQVAEIEEADPSPEDVVETEGEVQEMMIAEAVVAEEVDKTRLPEAFKIALKVREYADADELAGAITKATDDFKAATGSGRPFGQGPTTRSASVAEAAQSPKERRLAMRKHYHDVVLPNVGIFD